MTVHKQDVLISVCDLQVLAQNGDVSQDILSYVLDGYEARSLSIYIQYLLLL
jgi:hypothetical protein